MVERSSYRVEGESGSTITTTIQVSDSKDKDTTYWELESNGDGYFFIKLKLKLNTDDIVLAIFPGGGKDSLTNDDLVDQHRKIKDNDEQLWKLVFANRDSVYNLQTVIPDEQSFYIVAPSGGYLSIVAFDENNDDMLGTSQDIKEALKFKYRKGNLISFTPEQKQVVLASNEAENENKLDNYWSVYEGKPKKSYLDIFLLEGWVKLQKKISGKYLAEIRKPNKSSSYFLSTSNQYDDRVYFEIIFAEDSREDNQEIPSKADPSQITERDSQLTGLIWHFTGGMILAIGIVPILVTQEIRVGVFGLIRTYPGGSEILERFSAKLQDLVSGLDNLPVRLDNNIQAPSDVEKAVIAIVPVVTMLFQELYEKDLLFPVLKYICKPSGMLLLFTVIKYVVKTFWLPEVRVAELVASATVWAVDGVWLAVEYSKCSKG